MMIEATKLRPVITGAYNSSRIYQENEIVHYFGQSYVCKAKISGETPENSTYWKRVTARNTPLNATGDIQLYDADSNSLYCENVDNSWGVVNTLGKGEVVIKVSVKKYTTWQILLDGKIRNQPMPELITGVTYRFDLSDSSLLGKTFQLLDKPKPVHFVTENYHQNGSLKEEINLEYNTRTIVDNVYSPILNVISTPIPSVTKTGVEGVDGVLIYTPIDFDEGIIYYDIDSIGFKRPFWRFKVISEETARLRVSRQLGAKRTKRIKQLADIVVGGWFGLQRIKKEDGSVNPLVRLDTKANAGHDYMAYIGENDELLTVGTYSQGVNALNDRGSTSRLCRPAMPYWFGGCAYISMSSWYATMLDKDGNLWMWGNGESNSAQINSNDQFKPHLIGTNPYKWGAYGKDGRFGGQKVIHADTSRIHHSTSYQQGCLLTENGEVWTLGHQHGQGARIGNPNIKYDMFWLGSGHIPQFHLRELESGRIVSVGDCRYGSQGVGHENGVSWTSPQYVLIPDSERVTQVVHAGTYLNETSGQGNWSEHHAASLFLCESGNVYSSGRNGYGWLGIGRTDNYSQATPVLIESLRGQVAMMISATSNYPVLIAILKDGTIRTWGHNWHGALGIGNQTHQSAPSKPVILLYGDSTQEDQNVAGKPKFVYACGGGDTGYHWTALLREDGKVFTSGNNDHGTLGRGHVQTNTKVHNDHYHKPCPEFSIDTRMYGQVPTHGENIIAIKGNQSGNNAANLFMLSDTGRVLVTGNGYSSTAIINDVYKSGGIPNYVCTT